jgi:uncharacterized protein (DUF302 family)
MNLVYEKSTNKILEEALKALEENLKENNFGILWQLNFKDKLNEKNLEFQDDFVVLEVCNPEQAQEVLNKNIHIGYALPCKMVVRTEGEQTYIGMASPNVLIGLFDEPELKEVAQKVEVTLKKAIEASV